MKPTTDIWQFQTALSQRLLAWGGASVGVGGALALLAGPFWKGLGAQCAGWGLINAAIAAIGLKSSRSKAAEPASHTPGEQEKTRATLRRVLWINTGLDVGYIAGGIALASTKGREGQDKAAFWRGNGLGMVLQGGFLFVFDLIHALLLQ